MMKSASNTGSGIIATALGSITLVAGATGAFVELQDALNAMWGVEKKKINGVLAFLRARVISFAMVAVVAFLLLVSLVVSTVLSALGRFAEARFARGRGAHPRRDPLRAFAIITRCLQQSTRCFPTRRSRGATCGSERR